MAGSMRRRRGLGPIGPCLVLLLMAATAPPCWAGRKDPGAAWPEITEAERSLKAVPQDPEADAVILRKTRDGKIVRRGKYMANVLTYHSRIKVLTERGKEYAEVRIPTRKGSRVSGLEARTVKVDGTTMPVAPDQIFERLVVQQRGFKGAELVFKFPAVEPGAILEYRYEREDSFLYFIDPWLFAGPEFTLFSHMSQAVPENAVYTTLCDKCQNPEPERTEWREGKEKGRRFTLEMRDVPAYRDEAMMPPQREVSPRAEMVLKGWTWQTWEALGRDDALFTDWVSVARYVQYYYQKAYKLDEVLVRTAVAGWIQGITDPQERVRAIVRHVQADFRYRDYPDVYGIMRSIADLVKDRSADNEEKAVLLVAALRAIKVEPKIALVAGRHKGPLYTNYFSLSQFSHAIVGLPQADGSLQWIDPTVSYAPFGFLPWWDSGAPALLLDGQQSKLITLPTSSDTGASRYRMTLKPRSDALADIEVEAEFRGQDAVEMRQALVPASESERLDYLQDWVRRHRPGAALRSHALIDLETIDKPLRMTMSLEAPGLVTRAEDLLVVRGCVLNCYGANPLSRGERIYPFYLDSGWNEEQTVTILPPAGAKAGPMPAPAAARSSIGSAGLTCEAQPDGSVRCSRSFAAARGHRPAYEQNNIRAMYDRIVEMDRTSVTFQEAAAGAASR